MTKNRTAKAKSIKVEGKPLTRELSQDYFKEGASVKIDFETALDFILFQIATLKGSAKKLGKLDSLKYLEEMEVFLSTRITSLKIYPNPGKEIPYRYEVNYNSQEGETQEEVGNKIKGYLTSPTFNMILAQASPQKEQILEIIRQKEELRRKEEELAKREAEIKKKEGKVGKFRRSGHLTDQILKYTYPKDKNPQLSIFDSLKETTRKDIEIAGVEVKEIVEGIKLSPAETKVIDSLCRLLHETSQNSDPGKEDYYAGNIGYELVEYGEEKSTPAPKLAFTLYELTREYKGGTYVSGKDIDNVKQILTGLDSKKFLLSYVETTKKRDGGRIERKVEDFKKLIHILKISQTEYSKEDIELSKTEETIILLNPIFRRQIDSKFILYPNDINRRTIIAYGSHNLSDIALRLRDYLIRELSSKRYEPEINMDKLYYLLAEKWMRESRKKKVKEYTDKALETVKALGLLLSYEMKTASTGEPKIVFKLNKQWE